LLRMVTMAFIQDDGSSYCEAFQDAIYIHCHVGVYTLSL
jgi:hypothetical protein